MANVPGSDLVVDLAVHVGPDLVDGAGTVAEVVIDFVAGIFEALLSV
jgi:hypothetical protein